MKAALERELSALSFEEKAEVYTYLASFVIPPEPENMAPELLAELEQRLAAHRLDSTGSITLEQFRNREFGVQ